MRGYEQFDGLTNESEKIGPLQVGLQTSEFQLPSDPSRMKQWLFEFEAGD